MDPADSGLERGLLTTPFPRTIQVPFCPESKLSGVGEVDFLNAVWYRRRVAVPSDWRGRDVLLHFQAVDYDTTVWVDGREITRHRGGFSPFTAKLGNKAGREIEIVVRARDNAAEPQPRGKQSQRYENYGCFYTRTTGIWQTVWLEPVPPVHLLRPRITPNVGRGVIRLEQVLSARPRGFSYRATLADSQGSVVTQTAPADRDFVIELELCIPPERQRFWRPDDPYLYDLTLELLDDRGHSVDAFKSYVGLRSVSIEGKAVLINGQRIFQRLVLDQGYYPDGLLTAPSEEALVHDIELSLAAGFNGARLHQKVFEERFLYHADRLGYLVWGEFADWGALGSGSEYDRQKPGPSFITEWLEVLDRDYSHPCIIGWCPLNETSQRTNDHIRQLDDVTRGMYLATKAMDLTRPVLDASGYSHRVAETDIYDSHDYEQNPVQFAENHAGLSQDKPFINSGSGPSEHWSLPYGGQPFFISEFGGIWWNPQAKPDEPSWGYGGRPQSLEEFYDRFTALCTVLLENPDMFGYCYTQLTDVFQEQNGIFSFDRSGKFDLEKLRAAQQRVAGFEKE